MHKHEDAAIAAAILQGDINRYEELIGKYREPIYAIVARRVPAAAIPTVAHDVFVRAYQSLSRYKGDSPFGNWASRIAIRTCCDYWRQEIKHNQRQAVPPPNEDQCQWLELASACQAADEAERLIRRKEAAELLEWLLGQLSAEDRTLIESVYNDGMPLKEVAAAMGWSLVNTKVKALRARRKMRRLLESIGEVKS